MGYEWAGVSYQEKKVGGESILVFALAVAVALVDAAAEAARLCFRPILDDSFAFILGVYPLVVAVGAGAASRRARHGRVRRHADVFPFLAVLFVPVFYVVPGLARAPAARRFPAFAPPAEARSPTSP
jgi:multidrug efflux pump subunit AcrB